MATLDDMGTFLATQGSLTVGTDLFKGQMPTTPDACVAVIETGGEPPLTVFGTAAISTEYPHFQILCRGAEGDYATPRATAETLYRACAAALAQTIGTTDYFAMEPFQQPFQLDKDKKNRIVMGFNVRVTKELTQ